MNVTTSLNMKRMTFSLIVGACLFLASAPDASAHGTEYRPYIVNDHYVVGRIRHFPTWLRRDRDFQHWYLHSRYRFTRRMSWHRIYDLYIFERRYHRHKRKYYGNVYRDYRYRTHQKKWKKRNH